METLIEQLKVQIVEQLNLVDVNPAEIGTDEPLFGEGLGLDSIDGLELTVLLNQQYGIKVSNPASIREAFASVRTLAEFVQKNAPAEVAA